MREYSAVDACTSGATFLTYGDGMIEGQYTYDVICDVCSSTVRELTRICARVCADCWMSYIRNPDWWELAVVARQCQ